MPNQFSRINENNKSTVESPCIRNCCLNKEDYCLGCFRHLDEITGWQKSTLLEKEQILKLCSQRSISFSAK